MVVHFPPPSWKLWMYWDNFYCYFPLNRPKNFVEPGMWWIMIITFRNRFSLSSKPSLCLRKSQLVFGEPDGRRVPAAQCLPSGHSTEEWVDVFSFRDGCRWVRIKFSWVFFSISFYSLKKECLLFYSGSFGCKLESDYSPSYPQPVPTSPQRVCVMPGPERPLTYCWAAQSWSPAPWA